MARKRRSGGNNFYLPEREMSLKVVFDNLRNYAIVGGIVALAHWVDSGKFNLPTALLPRFYFPHNKPVVWAFLALAFVLLVSNAIQSSLILIHFVIGDVSGEHGDEVPLAPRHQSVLKRIWRYLSWVGVFVVVLACTFILFTFAMYLVLFAATGGR
jgi:hypothetical protein